MLTLYNFLIGNTVIVALAVVITAIVCTLLLTISRDPQAALVGAITAFTAIVISVKIMKRALSNIRKEVTAVIDEAIIITQEGYSDVKHFRQF